jgi:hypothetical protein
VKTALDVGCGPYYQVFERSIERVVRLDPRHAVQPDVECEVLKYHEQHDVVYASHLLEHVAFIDVLVKHLWSLVKDRGELRIAVPNLEWAAEQIRHGIYDGAVQRCVYGVSDDMDSKWNGAHYHRRGFTFDELSTLLKCYCGDAVKVEVVYWRNSLWARVWK